LRGGSETTDAAILCVNQRNSHASLGMTVISLSLQTCLSAGREAQTSPRESGEAISY